MPYAADLFVIFNKENISLSDRGDESSLDSYVSVFQVTQSCAHVHSEECTP